MRRCACLISIVVNRWTHFFSYLNAGKGRKNLKRPNPFTSEGVEEGSSSGLSSSQRNAITGTRPLPHNHVAKVSEAEAFLQDMSDSFRPHKILKVEPVDVPLPPAASRSLQTVRFPLPISWIMNFLTLTCLKLKLPRSSSLSSHLSSTSKATNPPESISSSSSLVSPKLPRAKVVPLALANYMFPPPSKPLPATTPISEAKMTMVPSPIRIQKDYSITDKDELISLPTPIREMLREVNQLVCQ